MSQRSKHEQLHRGTAITMSVYDERFRSLILPSKSSMNAPIDTERGTDRQGERYRERERERGGERRGGGEKGIK